MKLSLRVAFHFCLSVCLMFLGMGILLAVIDETYPLEGKSFHMIPFYSAGSNVTPLMCIVLLRAGVTAYMK